MDREKELDASIPAWVLQGVSRLARTVAYLATFYMIVTTGVILQKICEVAHQILAAERLH